MDQRNAGRSHAPLRATDGWQTYTDDQVALLDHLGLETAHVMGMCVGGPFLVLDYQDHPQQNHSCRFAAAEWTLGDQSP